MKKLLSLALIFTSVVSAQDSLKMYIFYSPSHKIFYDDWFLPSLKKTNPDIELIEEFHEQECSGVYMKDNWLKAMHRKLDLVIRAIKENWGDAFVHSDVDIQYFRPIKKELLSIIGDYDFMAQQDSPDGQLCCGFFICRANEKTLRLWQAVKQFIIDHPDYQDQWALTKLIKEGTFDVKWRFLPADFFSGGTLTGTVWNPGDELPVPERIALHHATWTVGIPNKIEQLEYVKRKVAHRGK